MTPQAQAEKLADSVIKNWAPKPGGLQALKEVIVKEYLKLYE